MNENNPDLFMIDGKVIVITGGGGELCGFLVQDLASRGCKVAILDINYEAAAAKERAVTDAGGTAKAFQCDVLDEKSLEHIYSSVLGLWGNVDALINGAGGNNPRGSTGVEFIDPGSFEADDGNTFFNLTLDGFRQTFDLNFLGTFLPTKIFTKEMVRRGEGCVVNFSSMSALNPLTKVGAYSAAKAAVANFTKWLAVHFAKTGVRVNALAPGFFMTEQLRFLHIDRETGEYTPRAKQVIAHTPMGRYGTASDLAGTVVWLLSEASSFITGIVVPIDGGFSSFSI
jgi:NAD(P)-dependent dehydrogenase (short-subunit alcohol dehydrogenase family)